MTPAGGVESRVTPMTSPALSRFVEGLADAVRDALCALAGIDRPREFVLQRHEGGTLARITVALDDGDVTLEAFDAALRRDAWFRTAHLGWSYHATAQRDPFAHPASAAWLRALRERVTERDRHPIATPAVRAALDAFARHAPFAGLRDEDFRLLMPGDVDGPRAVLWLGFGCNQDCDICWQRRDAPEPPAPVFARWLDELVAAGARSLIVSGGEPTLRDDLVALIRRAKAADVHVVLETNAIRLVDDALRGALRDAGLDAVSASLHGHDAATSDAITRTPGSHAQTLAGLEACLRDAIPTGIHCVVEARNASTLTEHAALVARRFPSARRVSYSVPTRYLDEARYRRSFAPLDTVRPQLTAATRLLRAANIETRVLGMSGFPLCATDEPVPEREVSASEREGHTYATACESCALRPRCVGVAPMYLDAWGERGLSPRRHTP